MAFFLQYLQTMLGFLTMVVVERVWLLLLLWPLFLERAMFWLCQQTTVIWSSSWSVKLSQMISFAFLSWRSALMAAMRLSLLWSFWMVSRLRANLMLSVKVSLAASRTLSRMPSFNPARKSWCLMNLKVSVMPSALMSAVVIPAINFTVIIDSDDKQAGSDGIPVWLAIKQRDVGRSFGTIMVIQDLCEVLSGRDIDDGSRWFNHRVCRWDQSHGKVLVAMLRVQLFSSASEGWKKMCFSLKKDLFFLSLIKWRFLLHCHLKKDCSCLTICLQYHIEGTEMRQLSCKVRRLFFLKY